MFAHTLIRKINNLVPNKTLRFATINIITKRTYPSNNRYLQNDILGSDQELEQSNKEYNELANKYFDYKEENCFVMHPYVKWGPKKLKDSSPEKQLEEAIALINTLKMWKVHDKLVVPLGNLEKRQLFGLGTLEKLKTIIKRNKEITAIFINISLLKNVQIIELETIFGVPILDRYKIVMHILRLHAISKQAKLQVALAEIPYLRLRLKHNVSGGINALEIQRKLLNDRENKIKNAIKKLRTQRELLRNKRRQLDFPVAAVVGYTNSGKTSLIKALTGEVKLEPSKELFSTLDVTVHVGILPSKMEILYVDTVGFISNIPTDLIECFIATLEDAMFADVIIHVQDASNEDVDFQSKHVLATLESLTKKIESKKKIPKIISVYNKIDKVSNMSSNSEGNVLVSAKYNIGTGKLLQMIEDAILKETNRAIVSITVPTGGKEYRWLYKNATIIRQSVDNKDNQNQLMVVIISNAKLHQFHHNFILTKE